MSSTVLTRTCFVSRLFIHAKKYATQVASELSPYCVPGQKIRREFCSFTVPISRQHLSQLSLFSKDTRYSSTSLGSCFSQYASYSSGVMVGNSVGLVIGARLSPLFANS